MCTEASRSIFVSNAGPSWWLTRAITLRPKVFNFCLLLLMYRKSHIIPSVRIKKSTSFPHKHIHTHTGYLWEPAIHCLFSRVSTSIVCLFSSLHHHGQPCYKKYICTLLWIPLHTHVVRTRIVLCALLLLFFITHIHIF